MKTLAMTTAAIFALSAPAFAQDMEGESMKKDHAGSAEYGETKSADKAKSPDKGKSADKGMTLEQADVMTETEDEFEIADADGNGELTQEEFVTAMAPPAPIGEGDADPALSSQGEPAESAAALPTSSEYLIAKFQTISGDDETVSEDELKEARKKDFEQADENGDDVLKGAELASYAALKRGRTAY